MNQNTPKETIIKLSNDPESVVLHGVCLNPNTPEEILLNYSKFSDKITATILANNPSLTKQGLVNIFNRFIDDIKKYAPERKGVEYSLLKRLLNRPELPEEIKEILSSIK